MLKKIREVAEETLGVNLRVKAVTGAEVRLEGEGVVVRYHRDAQIWQVTE